MVAIASASQPLCSVALFSSPLKKKDQHTQHDREHDEDDQRDLQTLVFAGHDLLS